MRIRYAPPIDYEAPYWWIYGRPLETGLIQNHARFLRLFTADVAGGDLNVTTNHMVSILLTLRDRIARHPVGPGHAKESSYICQRLLDLRNQWSEGVNMCRYALRTT